eukprot:TRINITY_DN1685_c0_g1_i1.p1 TRINITY_DN1685_c0_g1~~TRINITY_DN1685_c0_g1_i1.p1  ORF type:complete len:348 (-),score=73.18 TRINITY_DN1685_c0_g1_i1:176-1219(-)
MFKLRVYDLYEKFSRAVIGPSFRRWGISLVRTGIALQGPLASDDRLVPSLRNVSYNGASPQLNEAHFVAPNSVAVGRVRLGTNSSIWYGATLRGDVGPITLGRNVVVQDIVTMRARKKSSEIKVEDDVLIGPNSSIDSCEIQRNAYIGMGATVRQGARIEANAVVTAGAVIPENTVVPSNQIWGGNPAKYLRNLTNEEREILAEHHQELVQLSVIHSEETEKTFRQVIDDEDQEAREEEYNAEELALLKIKQLGFPVEYDDQDFIEQRVWAKDFGSAFEDKYWKKNYDPYEQDLYHYPDSFKKHQEDFSKYEKAKKYFEENPNVEAYTLERQNRIHPTSDEPWTRKY